jgi:hypothetical protein
MAMTTSIELNSVLCPAGTPVSKTNRHLCGALRMSLITVPRVANWLFGLTIGIAAASTALMALLYDSLGLGLRPNASCHAVAKYSPDRGS